MPYLLLRTLAPMKNRILLLTLSFAFVAFAKAQSISGTVTDTDGQPLPGASITIEDLNLATVTNNDGSYVLSVKKSGTFTVQISLLGYTTLNENITLSGENKKVNFGLQENSKELEAITITASKDYNNVQHMQEVEGTLIFSGKRNDVVILDKTNGNTAENIPRQVFNKVPGVYEWDFDGSGAQTSIAVRGLNPHRSWEFNVRENGYSVNSDVFGYPESHYNPATEALAKVELVRGGACLQYGPQYGGMLNYVMKEGPTDKKVDYETRQTVGSNNLFNSYNAIGGQLGKLNYYAYFNRRTGDGYRENSDYDFYAGYIGLHYAASERLQVNLEYSKMYYVNQLAGGLTDAQFEADPYQSTRSRNFFQPNHNIPALTIDYDLSDNTRLSLKSNMIIGQRNSVMYIAPATVEEVIDSITLQYPARTVDRDYYNSFTNELRILQNYKLGKQKHAFSAGVRYSDSRTHRQQKGLGTTGNDFDLSLVSPYLVDLNFTTINYAFCAENLFRITSKFSITPGVRYEIIKTNMEGEINFAAAPFDYNKDRNMPLGGLGLQYNLKGENNIYANATQAYRPILYSDLTPGATYDVIDPDMTDSKGFNSDLGIRGKLKEFLIYDIGYYYLQYGDRIGALALTDTAGNSYVYKTNVGTSVAQGVEALIEFHPTAFGGLRPRMGDLGIFVSAAYDNAVYKDAITTANGQDVQLEGNKLENAPDWIVRSGLIYNYKWLSTTLQGSYVSEIYSDALNTESSANAVVGVVPSYFIIDWNTTVRFSSYNFKLGINNLNDEVYFTRRINNYPGPGILPGDGRSFYISLGKEF